jgi:DNA (cytosine-5)-methyltransferase 1
MGFEQPGCTDFVIPVSDTQAYRQFGNAVVAIAAAAIAKSMFKYLPVQPGRQTQRRLPLRG